MLVPLPARQLLSIRDVQLGQQHTRVQRRILDSIGFQTLAPSCWLMQLTLTKTPPSTRTAGTGASTQAFSVTRFPGTERDSKISKLKWLSGSVLGVNTLLSQGARAARSWPLVLVLLGFPPHHAAGWQATASRFPRQVQQRFRPSAKVVHGHCS